MLSRRPWIRRARRRISAIVDGPLLMRPIFPSRGLPWFRLLTRSSRLLSFPWKMSTPYMARAFSPNNPCRRGLPRRIPSEARGASADSWITVFGKPGGIKVHDGGKCGSLTLAEFCSERNNHPSPRARGLTRGCANAAVVLLAKFIVASRPIVGSRVGRY